MTLGRALLALGDLDAAGRELGAVLHVAPENLAAWRGLGEVCLRAGRQADALIHLRRALALAPGDEELSGQIAELERQVPSAPPPGTAAPAAGSADPVAGGAASGRLLAHLERWLGVLEAGRPR